MANKLYAMEQLTEEVAKDVAASPQEWMQCLGTASIPADWQLHLLPPLPSAVPLHIIYLPCATPFHKIRDCLAQSP